jgi:hypothetical protein
VSTGGAFRCDRGMAEACRYHPMIGEVPSRITRKGEGYSDCCKSFSWQPRYRRQADRGIGAHDDSLQAPALKEEMAEAFARRGVGANHRRGSPRGPACGGTGCDSGPILEYGGRGGLTEPNVPRSAHHEDERRSSKIRARMLASMPAAAAKWP